MNPLSLSAASTISYVQGNYATPQTPQTTVSVTFTAAQASGDLNVVVVGWNDSTATVTAVTDRRGNAYGLAVGPTVQSSIASQSIYYAKNIASAAAGANTVTVTFSVPAVYADIRIVEYNGADTSNPVDITAANSGSSATSSSGSAATTTNATDLIFGANLVQTTTTGPGSGFTGRLLTSPDGDIAEDRMVTATGSYGATAPVSLSGPWIMQMVAFRTLSSGGSDTTPPTAPTGLTATGASGNQINLSWSASTDNVGVTGYLVERCQGPGCTSFAQIATPAATTYADASVAPGTTYSYRARATDAAGNLSSYSNVASTTSQATIPGLLAAYSFNEGGGTTVGDSSGNGNTGTILNANWTSSGKYGNALSFDGSTSYVDMGNPTALQLTGSMTLSAWVFPTGNSPDDGQIIAKDSGSDGWQLKTTPDSGVPTFGIAISNGATHIQRYSKTVPSLNTWYFVAGVFNAATQTLDIYVNGVLDNGVLSGVVPASQHNSTVNVNVGRRTGGYWFQGTVDEVRVYNSAISQAQIQVDMGTPVGSPGPLPVVSLSTTSINFGNQATGTTSSAKPVTVTNSGAASLIFAGITLSGANAADFAQTNNCGTALAPGSSCTVNVTFAPVAAGTRSAAINVADNAPLSPQTIALSGTGTAGFSISPRAVALTFTRTQQFTTTNTSGSITWSVDGVTGGSSSLGTITGTGLYTPPSSAGTHTVTATTTLSQSASATVYVTNYPGTFTYHNDNLRTGENVNEVVLTLSNVNQAQFGQLFSYSLDGIALASPLYVANVNIPGQGFHNVVYVATEHDSVYAFDADGASSSPLWKVSFLGSGATTVPCADTGECGDIPNEIGITGTPVIDQASGTLYVVAKTKEHNQYVQRLHALDITNGREKFGGPVVLQASVPGTGDGASGGSVPFDPLRENQRPGLLLSNGVVYLGFAAHGDNSPWHGWVLGYNATNLQRVMVYNATPNSYGGGIWQSGGGLASDANGNIYFSTGNGGFDANSGGPDYGDSLEKLSPLAAVLDYFTPHDQGVMEANDLELGSAGPVLLLDQSSGPYPHVLISAGKNGTIYVVNRDNMGHYNPNNDNQIVQSLVSALPNGQIDTGNFSAPVYFKGYVYFCAVDDTIRAFQLSNGLLSTSATSQSSAVYPNRGGAFAISANGSSNGILWVVQDNNPSNGVLRAYDATNLASELYNSAQAGSRDALDVASKFNIPLVANGKVFVASNGRLTAYGLLP
jgi:hypothetical protein